MLFTSRERETERGRDRKRERETERQTERGRDRERDSVAALAPLPVGFPQKLQGSAMNDETKVLFVNIFITNTADHNTAPLLTLVLHSQLRAFMSAASAAD